MGYSATVPTPAHLNPNNQSMQKEAKEVNTQITSHNQKQQQKQRKRQTQTAPSPASRSSA